MVEKCLSLCFLFIFSSVMLGFAQETETVMVKGIVMEIAEDNSYIIVDDTKILTTEDFISDCYLEEGDKVEITAEKTDTGLEAVNCEYVLEEEPAYLPEEEEISGE